MSPRARWREGSRGGPWRRASRRARTSRASSPFTRGKAAWKRPRRSGWCSRRTRRACARCTGSSRRTTLTKCPTSPGGKGRPCPRPTRAGSRPRRRVAELARAERSRVARGLVFVEEHDARVVEGGDEHRPPDEFALAPGRKGVRLGVPEVEPREDDARGAEMVGEVDGPV